MKCEDCQRQERTGIFRRKTGPCRCEFVEQFGEEIARKHGIDPCVPYDLNEALKVFRIFEREIMSTVMTSKMAGWPNTFVRKFSPFLGGELQIMFTHKEEPVPQKGKMTKDELFALFGECQDAFDEMERQRERQRMAASDFNSALNRYCEKKKQWDEAMKNNALPEAIP